MLIENCKIISKNEIAPNIFDFELAAPKIAAEAKIGQFVHIRCCDLSLRRPICICDVNGDRVRVTVAKKGQGTEWLSASNVGDVWDVIGSVGHGFPMPDENDNILLVGGGIGVCPLLFAAHKLQNSDALLGFQNKNAVILEGDFKSYCKNVYVTTDDGSYGLSGFVSAHIEKLVKENGYTKIFSCGPHPMLKATYLASRHLNIPVYVSTEEKMACGIGACLVCVCKVKKEGGEDYAHVCKDGPVFLADDLIWD